MSMPDNTPRKLYLFQLATATVPVGEGRTIDMVLGCYLVEMGDGRRILIDSGLPPDAPRPASLPPGENERNVIELLADLDLRPDDISMLICTHLDMDHAGYHDAFFRADLVIQREHYELARSGHPRLAAARAHWDHSSLHYRLVEGDTDLFPGLSVLKTGGHVLGHQSVLVRLPRTGPVLLAIDAVPLRRLFTVHRKASPNDEDEAQLRASTKKLLDVVEHEHVSLAVFGHDGEQWRTLKKAPDYYD
jgi:N-acyl homoserine lactone hydrolase